MALECEGHLDPEIEVFLQKVDLVPTLVLSSGIHQPILEDYITMQISVITGGKDDVEEQTQEQVAIHT